MSRLIHIRELREMLGHSNATVYRLIKRSGLPAPIKITTRTSAWDEDEIKQWISDRLIESHHQNILASKEVQHEI